MKRSDLTSGVKPPKFKVGKFVLNEYEAREMIARISEGTLDNDGIVIEDEDGNCCTIDKTGTTSMNIKGWDIASNFTIRKIRANRKINDK